MRKDVKRVGRSRGAESNRKEKQRPDGVNARKSPRRRYKTMQPPVFLSPGWSRDRNAPMAMRLVMACEETERELGSRCEAPIGASKRPDQVSATACFHTAQEEALWLWARADKNHGTLQRTLRRGKRLSAHRQVPPLPKRTDGQVCTKRPRRPSPAPTLICFTAATVFLAFALTST